MTTTPPPNTWVRSSAIGTYWHRPSLVIGACHLVQIRVWAQDPQSYIFLILWNTVELIHWSLSLGGLSLFVLYAAYKTFCYHFCLFPFLDRWPTAQKGRRTPTNHQVVITVGPQGRFSCGVHFKFALRNFWFLSNFGESRRVFSLLFSISYFFFCFYTLPFVIISLVLFGQLNFSKHWSCFNFVSQVFTAPNGITKGRKICFWNFRPYYNNTL